VNLSIKPHEKIGVVGRTGAGKSSLTLALFRIIEPSSGHIAIDDLNTSTIGLLDVRRRLAIIPQDAALFEGTVRDNLDPAHVRDDTELWSVLGLCKFLCAVVDRSPSLLSMVRSGGTDVIEQIGHARLSEHISNMPGKLNAPIHEGGM
jgi:ATP-binding cassette subfamily C (CFTR/MRP) protein 1